MSICPSSDNTPMSLPAQPLILRRVSSAKAWKLRGDDNQMSQILIKPSSISAATTAETAHMFSDKDVTITSTMVTIGDAIYPITDIAKVAIKEFNGWQRVAQFLCFACAIYFHMEHKYLSINVLKAHYIPVYGVFFLVSFGFYLWVEQQPASLIFHLPNRQLNVLQRERSHLKKIKAQIESTRPTVAS
jgi:hypothetical protein